LTPKSLLIHPADNVAIALDEIPAGASVAVLGGGKEQQVQAQNAVPFAHKIALRRIAKGEAVLKYGVLVAKATAEIGVGEWVHTHNAGSCYSLRREEARR